ncbi:hypothetical protein GCM10010344_51230 [Streptomyces bluensis]|nr:hypothetical protein GCM10010344_51230 [Streptomyces bluensis]
MGGENGTEGRAGDAGGAGVSGEVERVVPGRGYGGHGSLRLQRGVGRLSCVTPKVTAYSEYVHKFPGIAFIATPVSDNKEAASP